MIYPVLFSAISCLPNTPATILPTFVSKTNLPHVAFAQVIDQSLYLSTFDGNPFGGKDGEYYVPDANTLFLSSPVQPTQIRGSVTWPNTATKAPAKLFGTDGVVISGGFLVPGKTNGGIWFSSKTGSAAGDLVPLFVSKGFFYHQAEFYDVNGDGLVDILTCRAQKSLFGAGSGSLTYLQPMDRSKPLGPWFETVIGKGCDTFFLLEDVTGDGIVDIVSAEYWGRQITLIQGPNGRFDDASKLTYTAIDTKIQSAFSVQYFDINGDGKKDILATNHEGSGSGGVFAYEIPADLSQTWVRHDLAIGFPVTQGGTNQAAPGSAQAFFPDDSIKTSVKPNIVVAGDGSQLAYLLTPNNNDISDWSFTKNVVHACKSTVGGIAIGDVNRDGKKELYIPCYDAGYLATYKF